MAHATLLNPRERWIATGSLLLGMVSFTTAIMVANVVLPKLMTSLRADLDQAQWVLTAPAIAQTVVMPMVGWLTGYLGHRVLFISSLSLFCASSILSGMAWSLTSLVTFQSLGGIGVGLMQPIISAMMYQIFPPNQRGLALGLSLIGWSIGPAIGPIAGGYLVEWFNWRMAFYLSVPMSIAGLICAVVYLPNLPRPDRKQVDTIGLLTMSVGLVTLLMAMSQGRREGWDSSYIVMLLIIASICLVAFIVWECVTASPLVDLRLFRYVSFSLASVVVFVSTCAFRGTGVLSIVYLQRVLDFTPLDVGWLLLAGNIAYGLTVVIAGRLADKIDPSIPVIAGLWIFALGFFWWARENETVTVFVLIVLLTSRLASYGLVGSPNNLSAMRALPDTDVVMASGLFSLIRGIAGAVGPVLSAAYYDQRYLYHAQHYGQQHDIASWGMQDAMANVQQVLQSAGELPALVPAKTSAVLHQRLLAEATTSAYQEYFFLAAVAAVAGTLPALPWDRLWNWLRVGWVQTNARATQAETASLSSGEPVRDNAAD